MLGAVLLLASGCAGVRPWGYELTIVGEGDREVLHQAREAGAFVAKAAESPVVQRAGADVQAGATTLQKTAIGPPAVQEPYTPEASAKARERAEGEQTHQVGLGQQLLGLVGGLAGGAGWLAALMAALAGITKVLQARGTIESLVGSVDVLRDRLPEQDRPAAIEALKKQQGRRRRAIRAHVMRVSA